MCCAGEVSSHDGNALQFPITTPGFLHAGCVYLSTHPNLQLHYVNTWAGNRQKQTWRTHRNVESVTVYWWIKFPACFDYFRATETISTISASFSPHSDQQNQFHFHFSSKRVWRADSNCLGVNHIGRLKVKDQNGDVLLSVLVSINWGMVCLVRLFYPCVKLRCNWSINHSTNQLYPRLSLYVRTILLSGFIT